MIHVNRLAWAALAWACCQGLALRASEGAEPEPSRFGAQILAAWPRQDFKDIEGKTGLGVGLFLEDEIRAGLTVQTRVDYLRYPQNNQPAAASIASYTAANPLTLSTDVVSVGFELRKQVFLDGFDSGFLLAGLTASNFEFQTSAVSAQSGGSAITRHKDKSGFKLGPTVGIGYRLGENWDLALRYSLVTFGGTTLATVETGLSYRF